MRKVIVCDCGRPWPVDDLITGSTISCGCRRRLHYRPSTPVVDVPLALPGQSIFDNPDTPWLRLRAEAPPRIVEAQKDQEAEFQRLKAEALKRRG